MKSSVIMQFLFFVGVVFVVKTGGTNGSIVGTQHDLATAGRG